MLFLTAITFHKPVLKLVIQWQTNGDEQYNNLDCHILVQ